jgi:hypothetical protein
MGSSTKLALALVLGALAGRFLIPRLEPKTVHHVSVISAPGRSGCALAMTDVTTLAGRTINPGEQWFHTLGCAETIDHVSTIIDCRCPTPR